ncbi:MAG: transketolase [Metamycoplasmataceae bacterium]
MSKNNNEMKYVNAMRYFGLKSIQEAKGGHVGMAMSAAPITYTLFTKFINLNSKDGKWINRDRFVLSGGHGSMSVYPILHFAGLLDKQELINFKKEDSKTPGHPEFEHEHDNFIDASTGPLGQGFAMGVGMAIAQKFLERKTKEDFPGVFDHYTYVVVGDGDLQEGISYEASAIAGRLQLDKLIVLHDSNKFQLDSEVSQVSVENLKMRFESNEWFYQKISNDPSDIEQAIIKAQKSGKPSFIEVETIIAEGLSSQASFKGHHGVVGDEDLAKFNKHYGTDFSGWEMDQDVYDHFNKLVTQRGTSKFEKWTSNLNEYKTKQPKEFLEIELWINNKVDFNEILSQVKFDKNNLATRIYIKDLIGNLHQKVNNIFSLGVDVSSSTQIAISDKSFRDGGNALYLGIREFAMAAISNGINLHGGLKTIGGTFLVFADYMKSAIRLGAMMKIPNVFAFTHDSYQVGGDGPTHQPFDQLPMLRAIENVYVHRPCDEIETKYALIEAFESKMDTNILILSRQNLESFDANRSSKDIKKGAYSLIDHNNPDYVIAASGSEVALAKALAKELKNARVVSVPCLDKLINWSKKDLETLFKANKALVTIEASSDYKWLSIHQNDQKNLHIGAYEFGKSMDGDELYKQKGFDIKKIITKIDSL